MNRGNRQHHKLYINKNKEGKDANGWHYYCLHYIITII